MGLLDELVGSKLTDSYCDFDAPVRQWWFHFKGYGTLSTSVPWRIDFDGGIHIGYDDHGHRFGLPEPVDAYERIKTVTEGKDVEVVDVSEVGDIAMRFSGGAVLRVFPSHLGYDCWDFQRPDESGIFCAGGEFGVMEPHDGPSQSDAQSG